MSKSDSDPQDSTGTDPQIALACWLRDLAGELERVDRQLSSDDLNLHVADGEATLVASYELDSYDIDEDPNGLTEREIAPDGGTVDACPECDSTRIRTLVDHPIRGEDADHDHLCQDCGHTFDDPVERAPHRDRPPRHGLAGDLAEADPSDIGEPLPGGDA